MQRQDKDRHAVVLRSYFLDQIKTVFLGQRDVDNCQIRAMFPKRPAGAGEIFGDGADQEILFLVQQFLHAHLENGMVIDNEYSGHQCAISLVTETIVPIRAD